MGKKGLGETGKSYLKEMAIESLFEIPDELETWDMKRGNELEPIAFELIKREFEAEFLSLVPQTFVEYNISAGATPDGFIKDSKGNLLSSIEIKCPREMNFYKWLLDGKTIKDEYFWQMQMQMLTLGTDHVHFYNFIVENKGVGRLEKKIVDKCETSQKLIIERLDEASELLTQYKNILQNVNLKPTI